MSGRELDNINAQGLLDPRFKAHKLEYAWQCVLAMICVLGILAALVTVTDSVSIASLGASAFIAFGMPHERSSSPRLMIGGYIIGIVVGSLCSYLTVHLSVPSLQIIRDSQDVVFGGLAVGLTIFLMVMTQTEHPPAAGLALGFVLNGTDGATIAGVALGIIALVLLKTMLKPILVDLT